MDKNEYLFKIAKQLCEDVWEDSTDDTDTEQIKHWRRIIRLEGLFGLDIRELYDEVKEACFYSKPSKFLDFNLVRTAFTLEGFDFE